MHDRTIPQVPVPPVDPVAPDTDANRAAETPKDADRTGAFVPATTRITNGDSNLNRTGDFVLGTEIQTEPPSAAVSLPAAASPHAVSIPGHELLEELGRGGMGVVYKARQVKADRIVAVKLMLSSAQGTTRDRFDSEAKSAARLQHPNIVQVFEVGEVEGKPYFTQEFVSGESLDRSIRRALPEPVDAARLLLTSARAMAYAHAQGVIHRDIKPANILIATTGEPKIADFGLARRLEADSHLTRAGTILGTPSYMAPEQATGDIDRITASADVYSLGATLYELLTGRAPFKGANFWEVLQQVRENEPLAPRLLRPGVPRDLETICLKCLRKQPARRYESAAALAEELERYLAGEPILARRAGPFERAYRWSRRNKVAAALIAALGLMVAGTATAAAVIKNQRDIARERLDLYRGAVYAFVNEAPDILADNPLAGSSREEMFDLTRRLLEEAQDRAEVGNATDYGRLALKIRMGEQAIRDGRLKDAEDRFAEARTIAEEARSKETVEKDKATGNLAHVLAKQATLAISKASAARSQADEPEAETELEQAAERFQEVLKLRQSVVESPQSKEIPPEQALAELGRAHLNLAKVRNAQHAPDDAVPHARQAVTRLDEALAKLPEGSRRAEKAARDRAIALLELAQAAAESLSPEVSQQNFAKAVAGFDALVTKSPRNYGHRINLAIATSAFGDEWLVRWKKPLEAEKQYRIAREQYRAITASPDLVNFQQQGLALRYYALGLAAEKAGRAADARMEYLRCLELRDARVRDLEEDTTLKKNAPNTIEAKLDRMLVNARLARLPEVRKTADGVMTICRRTRDANPDRPKVLRDVGHLAIIVACGYSIASGTLPENDPLRTQLGTQSLDAVRFALDCGYSNWKFLDVDPDLDTVRTNPVFQELVDAARKGHPNRYH